MGQSEWIGKKVAAFRVVGLQESLDKRVEILVSFDDMRTAQADFAAAAPHLTTAQILRQESNDRVLSSGDYATHREHARRVGNKLRNTRAQLAE